MQNKSKSHEAFYAQLSGKIMKDNEKCNSIFSTLYLPVLILFFLSFIKAIFLNVFLMPFIAFLFSQHSFVFVLFFVLSSDKFVKTQRQNNYQKLTRDKFEQQK